MIYILLLTIFSISKALADAIFSHPDNFIWKGNFWKVWYKDEKVFPGTKYPLTGWHFANSIMICSALALPFYYHPFFINWVDYILSGVYFIVVFNLFYNHIFYKKN